MGRQIYAWPGAVSCRVTQRSRQQIGAGGVRNGEPESLYGAGIAPDHMALSWGLGLEARHSVNQKRAKRAGQMLNMSKNKEKLPGGPALLRPSSEHHRGLCPGAHAWLGLMAHLARVQQSCVQSLL